MKNSLRILSTLALSLCSVWGQAMPLRVGMANPAAVYCVQHGGRLLPVTTPYGLSHDCALSNKTRCDQWILYRQKHCPTAVRPIAKPQPRKPLLRAQQKPQPRKLLPRAQQKPQLRKLLPRAQQKQVTQPKLPSRKVATRVHLVKPAMSRTLADGYRERATDDPQIKTVAVFAANHIQQNARVKSIEWAQSRIAAGADYRLGFTLANQQRYTAHVYQLLLNQGMLVREYKLITPR